MNDSDKSLQEITSLVEAMLADADMPTTKPAPLDPILLAGELSARLADVEPGPPIGGSIPESKLAAYIDGGLDDGEQREVEALLAGSPACLHDIVAAIVYLDDLTAQRSSAPADLLKSTIAEFDGTQESGGPASEHYPVARSARPWTGRQSGTARRIVPAFGRGK